MLLDYQHSTMGSIFVCIDTIQIVPYPILINCSIGPRLSQPPLKSVFQFFILGVGERVWDCCYMVCRVEI